MSATVDSPARPARNPTIDVARGLGILLVVLGHNWLVNHAPGEAFRLIYSFHMALFFFLSGVFLRADAPFARFCRDKASGLLKPYFVVLVLVLLAGIPQRLPLPEQWLGVFFATGQSIPWMPLWFLPHLFLALVGARGVLALAPGPRSIVVIAALLLGVAAWWLPYAAELHWGLLEIRPGRRAALIGLPFSADLLPATLPYVLVGCLLAPRVRELNPRWSWLVTSLAAFIVLHAGFDETMNLNYRVYGQVFVSTIQAVAGICLILQAAGFIGRQPWGAVPLAYLGRNSLFILIFHGVVQGSITGRGQTWFPEVPVLGALLGLAAGVVLPLALYEVVKRIPVLSRLLLPASPAGSLQGAR